MTKKELEAQERFKERGGKILGYENACDACKEFIFKYAVQAGASPSRVFNDVRLVHILIGHYEGLEDYESCSSLMPFKDGFRIPAGLVSSKLLGRFIYRMTFVMDYDFNCMMCWEEIEEQGAEAVQPYTQEMQGDIDTLALVDRLLEYFRAGDERCKLGLLVLMREAITKGREDAEREWLDGDQD